MIAKKLLILFIVLLLSLFYSETTAKEPLTIYKKPIIVKSSKIKEKKTTLKKEIILKKEIKKSKVLSYSKEINEEEWISFEATFYNLCCNLTKSGRKLEDGVTVAVDPAIIPLGTWIEIKYHNGIIEQRRADDTGGAIKGRILDVYVAKPRNVLLQMGRQQVKVRIIKKGEK